MRNPQRFTATLLIARTSLNVALVTLGAVTAMQLAVATAVSPWAAATYGGVITGLLILAFCELIPRSVTVPRAATEAVVVLLGCLPWFVVLGIVEAFLSPSETLHPAWKVMLGLALQACFFAPVAIAAVRRDPPAAEGAAAP